MTKNLISNTEDHCDWKSNIKKYENNKKTLEWGTNPKQTLITTKIVKDRDTIFNPILQVYNNKEYENHLKNTENVDLIRTLAKNKVKQNANLQDRSLRYEQTFYLITLKDKLKCFENHPDYPKEKTAERIKKTESTKANYNIISSKNLKEHHYDAPEKRPNIQDTVNNI